MLWIAANTAAASSESCAYRFGGSNNKKAVVGCSFGVGDGERALVLEEAEVGRMKEKDKPNNLALSSNTAAPSQPGPASHW